MRLRTQQKQSLAGVEQLTLRSLVIGMLGSCLITASSMYVALRMSALPWPTIFVAVLSMALLKLMGGTTQNEINVTQTAMSAGAMVAGGLAFTLPGLWISGKWSDTELFTGHFWQVMAISAAGFILGTVTSYFLRQKFIEGESLPYPIGAAAAETITVGDAGGAKSAVLFSTLGLSAAFTYIRDSLGLIPSALVSKWLYARNFYVGLWVSPMAVGIGYMVGPLFTGVWFAGAVLSYLLIIPIGTASGLFPSAAAAVAFKNTAGIGLMVGTGLGIFISFIISWLHGLRRNGASPENRRPIGMTGVKRPALIVVLPILGAFILSVVSGLGAVPSILLILGVFAASSMAATITGQTGINPMEIFGIIILLAVRLIIDVDAVGAFFIAACVAIACGYAGDLLNDYKTGHVLGTNPMAQLISQTMGGVVGVVVASVAMFAIIGQFGGVGPDKGLPAGQAYAVSQMVNGIGNPLVFGLSLAVGAALYLLKLPAMTLGIGMYLSFEISAVVFAGGLVRLISDRLKPSTVETGNVAASGLLGGEGITGVVIAIVKMVTGS